MTNPACPYARVLNAVAERIAQSVEGTEYNETELAEQPSFPESPFGAIVVTFCRECDCTHASYFAPDGCEEASPRALNALRVAVANTESEITNDIKKVLDQAGKPSGAVH